MWANAQRDGRLAEYRWRPLFNAAVWLWSNAAKTRNPMKFAGVPQTRQQISAASGLKFTVLCCLTVNLPIVNMCLSCEDRARQSYAMVLRWRIFGDFLHPVFSASRVQHVSDLHSKFALAPHHVSKYGRHPIYGR